MNNFNVMKRKKIVFEIGVAELKALTKAPHQLIGVCCLAMACQPRSLRTDSHHFRFQAFQASSQGSTVELGYYFNST